MLTTPPSVRPVLNYSRRGIDWSKWRVRVAISLGILALVASHSLGVWVGYGWGVQSAFEQDSQFGKAAMKVIDAATTKKLTP